jgi:ATP-dependent exoDNAse (exonuclease V) beta subunit
MLTVYKASAGSGKTFQLVVEYLKLLLKNPQNYRHILAVTFTNKATNEMKTRILETLNQTCKQPAKRIHCRNSERKSFAGSTDSQKCKTGFKKYPARLQPVFHQHHRFIYPTHHKSI